jgi:ABC-2 type transport system ATP-binding protein
VTDQPEVIAVRGLVRKFGDFTAVAGIDFSVQRGEIFGLLGPNGSGKTTTIRMMLGLLAPTEGNVEVFGQPVARQAHKIRPRLGYMSQRFSLYNDLTVRENLLFYGRAYGLKNQHLQERMGTVLQMAGLQGREAERTRELSGGWRQRLALGAAILHQPELIFLDEPTAGVDPVSRRAFWELLYRLIAEGITVFVTTHYMDEAEHCHRLAFIQHGSLIAMGTPAELKAAKMEGRVLEVVPADASRAMQTLQAAQEDGRLEAIEVSLHGALVHVITRDPRREERAIRQLLKAADVGLQGIGEIEPSLEDVFIACMR